MNVKLLILAIFSQTVLSFEEIGLIDPKFSDLQKIASERMVKPQVDKLVDYLKPRKRIKRRKSSFVPNSYIDNNGEFHEQDEVIDIIVD